VVQVGRRLIAAGSRQVAIGRRATVIAPLTTRGREIVRAARRRGRSVTATVKIALPGTRTIRRTIILRP
jgi:hypothetical protein